MSLINKCCFPIGLYISLFISISSTSAQTKQIYQVYKLENKIGTEEVSIGSGADSSKVHIAIRTKDRGYELSLISDVIAGSSGYSFKSIGNTSRFKSEHLDTVFTATAGFPLSDNGSIKMRELLIAEWLNAGKPSYIQSALGNHKINIQELVIPSTADRELKEMRAFLINRGLDEVFWMDKKGKSVFLTNNDTEGDKREIVAELYLQQFSKLNTLSTQFLLQAYSNQAKKLGNIYSSIAIIGGTIIDLENSGEIQKNTMVLIADGKITYVGTINKSLISPGTKVIDATNKFLVPGLWDMHAHIFHPSYLQKEILSGVTSLRDMANEFDVVVQLKALAEKGEVPAPNIYAAGLLDGKSPTTLGTILATNADEIKTNVQRYHDAGFSQIKIYDNIKKKDFDIILKEAKRNHMDVVGHLPSGYTISYFINNGMKSISHIHYFMNSMKWSTGNFISENRPLLESLKSHQVYLDPTLNVYQLVGDKRIPAFKRLFKLFSDYGIPVVAGTDNEGTIPDELQTYVQFGMSPLNALRAATSVPAAIMGAAQESGSIVKGKNGDLLILDDNPLLNIGTLKNIRAIIKGRFVINPQAPLF